MDRVAWLRSVVSDKPNDRFALYSLALELRKAGDHDAAVAGFVDLLERHPTSGAGHYQHGLTHLEADDEEAALIAWRAGVQALCGVSEPEARRSLSEIQGALADLED